MDYFQPHGVAGKMSTAENLLVQIFERKNAIIEQVRQQTESYSQHLASKLLAEGIAPPSWLWNPKTSGSKELNKEELISKLLCSYPQPSAHCSVARYPGYNNIVIRGDNEEFCDGVFVENPAFSKGLNRQDDLTAPALSSENHAACTYNSVPEFDACFTSPEDQTDERILNIDNALSSEDHAGAVAQLNASVTSPDERILNIDNALSSEDHAACTTNSVPEFDASVTSPDERILNIDNALSSEDHAVCTINSVPKLDASVTSPEDQTDDRILNIYNAPDQSLAGIQRSKSRQRALELRSSAKAAKSSLNSENKLPKSAGLCQPVAYNENTSFVGTISKSDCKQKSAEEELQDTSSGPSLPFFFGAHNMLHDDKNGSPLMVSELVVHDHIDQCCSSGSSYAKQRRELESQIALITSDSFEFVEPKQLDFKEIEDYNLKVITSTSGKGGLDNTPEKMSCSLSAPDVLLDEGMSCGANQLSARKQSPGILDVSSEADKAHGDSFESDVQENRDIHAENFGPAVTDTMSKACEDNTEAGLNCIHNKADNMLSKMVDIPDMEEGDWSCEDEDTGQLVSSSPGSKNSRLSHCHSSAKEPRGECSGCLIKKVEMTNAIVLDEITQFPAQQYQILSCLEGQVRKQQGDSPLGDSALEIHRSVRSHGENLSLERRFRCASMESWPQLKRRKIEHQQTRSFATSPSFRVTKPHSIQRRPANTYLKSMEINLDTAFMEHVHKSMGVGISLEVDSNLMEGIESTFLSQHGEVGSCYKEKNEHNNSSSDNNNEKLEAILLSSLTMEDSRNSQGCFLEGIRTSHSTCNQFDAKMSGDEQFGQHLCNLEKNTDNLNSENLKLTNTLLEGMQSPKWEDGLHAQHSVRSPSNEGLQLTDGDQSIPVFEGFVVATETATGGLDFAADGFDFDELNLPTTTLEHASILAEICRSASLDKPSSHYSSALEFQGTQNLFQSIPKGGHLEHLDLRDTFPLNSDVGKHLQSGSSSSDDYKDVLDGMPYSVSLAYSGAQYGWNSRNQHASPVGKLWEQLSSHTGSSEKRLSSNPELACFPIEEDPSISEENNTVDENAGDVQEDIDSALPNQCDKRQPLKDLTNLGLNHTMSVSGEEGTLKADSADIVSTKLSVIGTQEKVDQGPKYQHRNKSETSKKQASSTGATVGRKNQPSSIGANGIKKAKESMNNSISKPLVSNKTSLKGQDQKLSLEESRRNNIVSNVSSFIPLMQQNQAATACAGKRDVKVKALEAAQAAKRLEEKKANERQMRKEALKLERAKLEAKKLRHMELEKKKKEEERKKKDADIIAKKRLREEEQRKEKEKKKMRVEARQRQREQEEKKRAEKAEKENQRSKDEQMNSKNEFHNELQKQQSRETTRGDDVALQKPKTKLTLTEVVMNYEECSNSGISCEAAKAMHTVDKSPSNEDLIVQNSQGKSYEISPYQCSDDEDEEDGELPTKKYIPSWASKTSVALHLPLQQELDPDVIFPPESFCSINEVVLPRKLQQKQVAA